jgi:hypothetical protein
LSFFLFFSTDFQKHVANEVADVAAIAVNVDIIEDREVKDDDFTSPGLLRPKPPMFETSCFSETPVPPLPESAFVDTRMG